MEQKTERQTQEDPRPWNDSREKRPVPVRATAVAKVRSIRERMREARPTKKNVFGLMVVAAVITMVVGFNWGGWVTGGTALQRADAKAQDAVLVRMTSICVAQFNLDPQKGTKLDALKAITSSWDRPDYVKKQGWATMPGEAAPDSNVAAACSKILIGS